MWVPLFREACVFYNVFFSRSPLSRVMLQGARITIQDAGDIEGPEPGLWTYILFLHFGVILSPHSCEVTQTFWGNPGFKFLGSSQDPMADFNSRKVVWQVIASTERQDNSQNNVSLGHWHGVGVLICGDSYSCQTKNEIGSLLPTVYHWPMSLSLCVSLCVAVTFLCSYHSVPSVLQLPVMGEWW